MRWEWTIKTLLNILKSCYYISLWAGEVWKQVVQLPLEKMVKGLESKFFDEKDK